MTRKDALVLAAEGTYVGPGPGGPSENDEGAAVSREGQLESAPYRCAHITEIAEYSGQLNHAAMRSSCRVLKFVSLFHIARGVHPVFRGRAVLVI